MGFFSKAYFLASLSPSSGPSPGSPPVIGQLSALRGQPHQGSWKKLSVCSMLSMNNCFMLCLCKRSSLGNVFSLNGVVEWVSEHTFVLRRVVINIH